MDNSSNLTSNETTGRISYENRGECFFLPYTKDDVEGNVNLKSGDKVSFQIATNQRYILFDRYLVDFFSVKLCAFIEDSLMRIFSLRFFSAAF